MDMLKTMSAQAAMLKTISDQETMLKAISAEEAMLASMPGMAIERETVFEKMTRDLIDTPTARMLRDIETSPLIGEAARWKKLREEVTGPNESEAARWKELQDDMYGGSTLRREAERMKLLQDEMSGHAAAKKFMDEISGHSMAKKLHSQGISDTFNLGTNGLQEEMLRASEAHSLAALVQPLPLTRTGQALDFARELSTASKLTLNSLAEAPPLFDPEPHFAPQILAEHPLKETNQRLQALEKHGSQTNQAIVGLSQTVRALGDYAREVRVDTAKEVKATGRAANIALWVAVVACVLQGAQLLDGSFSKEDHLKARFDAIEKRAIAQEREIGRLTSENRRLEAEVAQASAKSAAPKPRAARLKQ
jgi:hypothetical protein